MLNQEPMGKGDGPPPPPTLLTCKGAPYMIIGPCLKIEQCEGCRLGRPEAECDSLHCRRWVGCLGMPQISKCKHKQCPNSCPHRKIELWQQYFVDDGDLIAATRHGLRTRILASATTIYAFGMAWKPSKYKYTTI